MMLDEPYRWAEAVANRREYIEDQLRSGSPVVGTAYASGALLLTLGQGQPKLFEVYDQIGMGALGHPTDIEKLRQAAVDLAHVIGFNYSDADVTLQQVVHFGLGPEVKRAFDEIFRSPYIVRLILAEVSAGGGGASFYSVDYDGRFQRTADHCAVGGSRAASRAMQARLDAGGPAADGLSLEDALDRLLLAWAAGRRAGSREEEASDPPEGPEAEADLSSALGEALTSLSVEAAVIETSTAGRLRYRALSEEETAPVVRRYQRQDNG